MVRQPGGNDRRRLHSVVLIPVLRPTHQGAAAHLCTPAFCIHCRWRQSGVGVCWMVAPCAARTSLPTTSRTLQAPILMIVPAGCMFVIVGDFIDAVPAIIILLLSPS
jgi:hypothetical protein